MNRNLTTEQQAEIDQLNRKMEAAGKTGRLTHDEMKAAGQKFCAMLERMADNYAQAIRAGADQRELFEATRDRVAAQFGWPLRQAANFVRVIIALMAKRVDEFPYSKDEFRQILQSAFNVRPMVD